MIDVSWENNKFGRVRGFFILPSIIYYNILFSGELMNRMNFDLSRDKNDHLMRSIVDQDKLLIVLPDWFLRKSSLWQ